MQIYIALSSCVCIFVVLLFPRKNDQNSSAMENTNQRTTEEDDVESSNHQSESAVNEHLTGNSREEVSNTKSYLSKALDFLSETLGLTSHNGKGTEPVSSVETDANENETLLDVDCPASTSNNNECKPLPTQT